jgi:hypothetical protein
MLALVRSIRSDGAQDTVAADTSMHDLVVTPAPVSDLLDQIRARLFDDGRVRVEHAKHVSPGDEIERDGNDLLALFRAPIGLRERTT